MIICDIGKHLDALSQHFDEYFTNDNIENFDWIRNPFDVEMSDLAGRELKELAELSCDRTLKIQFREKSLSAFWLSVSTEYPLLSNKAVNVLLPFATTYLCETLQTITTFWNPLADPVGTRREPPLVRGPQFENRWLTAQ